MDQEKRETGIVKLDNPKPTIINIFPSIQEWNMMKEQASVMVNSGFLPQAIKRPEQAITVMLFARELGIGPMTAFKHINVINGTPGMDSELMMAKVHQLCPGAQITFVELSNERCIIDGSRPGKKLKNPIVWTIKDAEKAQLLNKTGWRLYPRAMLRSRAIAELCRTLFQDCLCGLSHTPEELGADVKFNDNGEVEGIIMPSEEVAKPLPEPSQEASPIEAEEQFLQHNDDSPTTDWDESKVIEKEVPKIDVTVKGNPNKVASDKQRKMIWAISKSKGVEDDLKTMAKNLIGKEHSKDWTNGDVQKLKTYLESL